MEYDQVLQEARDRVERERPDTSTEKKAAFANSVAYLVSGASGGYGGPSVREHSVSWAYGPGGRYAFEEACELLLKEDGLIFSPIQDIHREVYEAEYCFDDDYEDLKELHSS